MTATEAAAAEEEAARQQRLATNSGGKEEKRRRGGGKQLSFQSHTLLSRTFNGGREGRRCWELFFPSFFPSHLGNCSGGLACTEGGGRIWHFSLKTDRLADVGTDCSDLQQLLLLRTVWYSRIGGRRTDHSDFFIFSKFTSPF